MTGAVFPERPTDEAGYPWLDLKKPSMDDLRAGDIIFFMPKDFRFESRTLDFDLFPVVAAFVQSFPYGHARPWHHVAVCTEDGPEPSAIGFGVVDGPEHFGAELHLQCPLEIPQSYELTLEIDALRPPPEIAADLVAIFRNQLGTRYALGGLLGFGTAMMARMLPEGDAPGWFLRGGEGARERAFDLAYGADQIAQAIAAETCVSHVAKAVEALVPLSIPNAPPPTDRGADTAWLDQMVKALVIRIGAIPSLPRPPGLPSAGHVLDTDVYLEALQAGIEQDFEAFPSERLAEIGRFYRSTHGDDLSAASLLVSPAMLHEALVRSAGFSRVGS